MGIKVKLFELGRNLFKSEIRSELVERAKRYF